MEISRHGRIDDLGKLLLGVQASERPTSKKPADSQHQDRDRIEISDAAKELQRVRELTHAEGATRSERVAQLRQAVESGTYTATGRTVAERMILHTLAESVL